MSHEKMIYLGGQLNDTVTDRWGARLGPSPAQMFSIAITETLKGIKLLSSAAKSLLFVSLFIVYYHRNYPKPAQGSKGQLFN
jgi:hypothetical protein